MRLCGQSTVEYAVIAAVVVGALLAMQIYIKRGVQGKLRSAADDIGEQFSPTAYKGKFEVTQKSATRETLHIADQGIGESKSETVTEGGIEHIFTGRKTQDGTVEELTNRQDDDKLLPQ